MRFNWAKGNKICRQCEEIIRKEEHQVHITFKGSRGYWIHLYYHQNCYLEYLNWFISVWFEEHPSVQKKMGRRPVITYDREKRRRLMALYRYHREQGNTDRMETIEHEITQLSYGVSPYPS